MGLCTWAASVLWPISHSGPFKCPSENSPSLSTDCLPPQQSGGSHSFLSSLHLGAVLAMRPPCGPRYPDCTGANGPLCSPAAAAVPRSQALALRPTPLFPVLPWFPSVAQGPVVVTESCCFLRWRKGWHRAGSVLLGCAIKRLVLPCMPPSPKAPLRPGLRCWATCSSRNVLTTASVWKYQPGHWDGA